MERSVVRGSNERISSRISTVSSTKQRRAPSKKRSRKARWHDVNLLVRTYGLLDELLISGPDSSRADFRPQRRRVAAMDQPFPSVGGSDTARRGVIYIGWVAGLVLAAVGGFLLTNQWIPDESRMLVEELPLIENLDDYSKVESIEFLRELQARVGSFDDASKTPRN
jgi:hypothetical protein